MDIGIFKEIGNIHPQGIQANQGSFNTLNPDAKDLCNNLFSRNQQDVYNEQDVISSTII